MSFSKNRTNELWQAFMSQRNKIKNSIGTNLYSVEVYPPQFFARFDPEKEFDKWAAVEVTDFDAVPEGMETVTLSPGVYAVFTHQGTAAEGFKTYRYIFDTWLPASDFLLDDLPHFAIMGEKYRG